MTEALTVISAAVGAAVLAVKLLKDGKAGEKPADGGATSRALPANDTTRPTSGAFLPQARPGPADQGGPQIVYQMSPGVTPADLVNLYAAMGTPHDAGAVITIYQGGATPAPGTIDTPPPGVTDPPTTTPDDAPGPTTPTPPTTPDLPPTVTREPDAPPGSKPPTHQDPFGRTQPGPPSDAEILAKGLGASVGGMVMEAIGTAKATAAQAASGAKTIRGLAKAGGAGGAVIAGAGLGLQIVQAMEHSGVFQDHVKPSGAAFSQRHGETVSKTVATLALPLTVPGAIAKALVTPGESVVGNLYTAAEKSAIPEAVAGARGVLVAADRKLDALRGDIWGGISRAQEVGASLGNTARSAAGDAGHKINQSADAARKVAEEAGRKTAQAAAAAKAAAEDAARKAAQAAQAAKSVAGDVGHKFNQGAATLTGFVSRRWF